MQKVINSLLLILLIFISNISYGQSEPDTSSPYDLAKDYLEKDISTSSYYDLLNLLKQLNLKTDGDINVLRNRLLEFYKISPNSFSKQGNKITIKDAQKSSYFSIDEVKQKYISLEGGVSLIIEDGQGGEHQIMSDTVIFNEKENLFTAKGNIEYLYIRDGAKDKFLGEYITFSINKKDVISLKSYVRKNEEELSDSEVRVYGKSILRSQDNIIIVKDAIATKSRFKIPAYSIRAEKIWIISSKEWGLENGFLYIGEVPVFYIGFLFYPGAKIVFHPNFGISSEKGSFIQTTTYLLSQQEQEDVGQETGALSGFFDTALSLYKEESENLHLIEDKTQPFTEQMSSNKLKLLIDGYTSLGFFSGLDWKVYNNNILKKSELFASIGFTKLLYETDNGLTDRYVSSDGVSRMYWKNVNIGKNTIPFRYGFYTKQDISYDMFSASFDFRIYSDPNYFDDFIKNRKETFQWGKLLGLSNDQETEDSSETISSLTQLITFNLKPSLSKTAVYPYISSLSISDIEFKYYFYSKGESNYILTDYMKNSNTLDIFRYYYPDTLTAPSFKLSMEGELFSYPNNKKEIAEAKNEFNENFISPFIKDKIDYDKAVKDEEKKKKEGIYLHENELDFEKINTSLLTFKLSYNNNLYFINQYKYNPNKFLSSRDLTLDSDYNSNLVKNIFKLNYNLNYLNRLITFDGGITFSDNYETTNFYNNTYTKDQKYNIEENNYNTTSNSMLWDNHFKIYFFNKYQIFKDTNAYYNISNYIYKRYYTFRNHNDNKANYNLETTAYNDTFFQAHNTGLMWDFKFADQHYYNDTTLSLPPRKTEVSNKTYFDFSGIANFSLQFRYGLQDNLEYSFFPITMAFSYNYPNWLKFKQTADYNYKDKHWQNITSRLDLWKFYTQINVDWTKKYNLNKSKTGFEASADEDLRLKEVIAGVDLDYVTPYFWKNRIAMGFGLDTSYHHSFIKFEDIYLDFKFTYDFYIYKFLSLSLSINSKNSNMYLYYKKYTDDLGIKQRNFWQDLGKSLNVSNSSDLKNTQFKISSVTLDMVHDLGDWDLTVRYEGTPKSIQKNNQYSFEWDNYFSFVLRWKDIQPIQKELKYKDKKLNDIEI